MKKLDYNAQIEYDLHDMGTIQKEELLRHHSEKMAVTFVLIIIPLDVLIRRKEYSHLWRLSFVYEICVNDQLGGGVVFGMFVSGMDGVLVVISGDGM